MTKQLEERKKEEKRRFSKDAPDYVLIVTVILLLGIGLVMVFSASEPTALANYSDSAYYFKQQLKFAIVGVVIAAITSKFNYRYYKVFCWSSYILSIILLAMVLVVGDGAKGAVRWISIGSIRFQPSELVKLLLINFNASYIVRNIKQIQKKNLKVLLFQIAALAIILFLLYKQPHFSALLIIVVFSFAMYFASGYDLVQLFIITLIGFAIIFALLFAKDYRKERLTTFTDPFANSSDEGYQIIQSLYAIGSGGAFGVGLGKSRQKYSYLPEPYNDFIFSIIGEELGFVGCVFIIGLYMLFIFRGYTIAARCNDLYGSLLAIGITTMFAIQIMFNIAVTISLVPVTGISLPFMSYGGTALIIQLFAVGVLVNISRSNAKRFAKKDQKEENLTDEE